MRKILKIAIVLLIVETIVYSSIGIAETVKEKELYGPNIDVEKYVYDEKNQLWIDADTENTALDKPICSDATFKIIIHNNGDSPISNLHVTDAMVDGLEFISADPDPYEFQHNPPYYNMFWLFPGPLNSCEMIEIYISAHVEGPECSTDYNYVEVLGISEDGTTVTDEDYCFVHAIKQSKDFYVQFKALLDSNPNLFPIIQKLLFKRRVL